MKKRKNHLSTALKNINKDVFRRLLFIKRNLKSQNKKKKQDSRAGQMLISPIDSDDFVCIPIFVEFRAVTGNPPTQSHKSVMNQGHIQGKREENRSSKKRRGTGEKKLKKQIKKQIV